MNTSIIRRVLGWLLALEGAFMLLPFVVGLLYREDTAWYFLGVGAFSIVLGLALAYKKAASSVFYMREGCIATAFGWIELSFFGCLPFYLSGEIPRFTDAMLVRDINSKTTAFEESFCQCHRQRHSQFFTGSRIRLIQKDQ